MTDKPEPVFEFACCVSPLHGLPGHVERPARVEAVAGTLRALGLRELKSKRLATREEVGSVHEYFDELSTVIASSSSAHIVLADEDDPDGVTYATRATSIEDARKAVGTVLDLVDRLFCSTFCSTERSAKFAAVRPPGHHASRSGPMGFCIFNNVAIAAEYARSKFGVRRILIVDFDLHNGNGTTSIFYEDKDTTVVDIHEEKNVYKIYDEEDDTGSGPGVGSTFNIPLKAGASQASVLKICDLISAIAAKFCPSLILVSAGFDAHTEDLFNTELGTGLAFTDQSYRCFGRCLQHLAAVHCDNRILFVLEGGYNTNALARSFGSLVRGCHDDPGRVLDEEAVVETEGDIASRAVLDRVRRRIAEYQVDE